MGASDTFDVVILAFDTDRETSPATELQRVFGIDQNAAWRLVDNLPMTVQRGVPPVRAEYFRRALSTIGASVEVRDGDGNLVEAPPEPEMPAPAAAPPADEATAATLDGTVATQGFDQASAHAALRQTIHSNTSPGTPVAKAAPKVAAPAIRQAANETLREAVPAPVAVGGAAPATAAAATPAVAAAPTAFGAAAPATGPQAPVPAATPAGSETTHLAEASPAGAAAAATEPAPRPAQGGGWAGSAELDMSKATAEDARPAVRAPMAHLRSDVFDPPPTHDAPTKPEPKGPSGEAPEDPVVIERHRADHKKPEFDLGAAIPMTDKWEAPTRGAQDGAPAGGDAPALDLDDDATGDAARAKPEERKPPPKRKPPAAEAAPGSEGPDGTLEDLPAPLINPPPAKGGERKRRRRPAAQVGEARPQDRPRREVDTRSFWETLFAGVLLPFTGPGGKWLLTVVVWSLIVGGIGVAIADLPLIGPFVIFFLNAALMALVCDYFRVAMWVGAAGEPTLDRGPDLDPVHLFESYMKQGIHPLLFLTASQLFAIWWIVSQALEDVPAGAIAGDPVTWAVLLPPAFYWPMAVAQTALRNDFVGIWNVPAGFKAMFRAPLKYLVVCLIGAIVFVLAFGITGPVGKILGVTGPLLSATLGLPMALSHGIMGGLTGHLARSSPEVFED